MGNGFYCGGHGNSDNSGDSEDEEIFFRLLVRNKRFRCLLLVLTPSACKSLQTAISTLELVSDHFLAAKNAAQVVREVSCQADRLIDHFQQGLSWRQGLRGSQSLTLTTMAQNGKALSKQTSLATPGQQSASVKWALPPTAMEVTPHQSMASFEARVQLLDMIPIGSLPELSLTLDTTESAGWDALGYVC